MRVGKQETKPYTTGKKEYIVEPASGFYLSGADNEGQCWNDNVNGKDRYYDDPILEFNDSMLYGCHLDLSYKELE